MKKLASLLCLLFIGLLSCSKLENVDDVCTKMDDITFMDYCYKNFDVNSDGKVSMTEAAAVREINVNGKGIVSLKGIEYFTALTVLDCSVNSLESLVVSKNTTLTKLVCNNNNLTSIDVSNLPSLYTLSCGSNPIKKLDVSRNGSLNVLNCRYCELTQLDLSNNVELTDLTCNNNLLTTLDISLTRILLLTSRDNLFPVLEKLNDGYDGRELKLIVTSRQYNDVMGYYKKNALLLTSEDEYKEDIYKKYKITFDVKKSY